MLSVYEWGLYGQTWSWRLQEKSHALFSCCPCLNFLLLGVGQYLFLLLETWGTWDSSTCVWFTWDVLDIFLRLEVLEIHMYLCVVYLRCTWHIWDLRYLRFIIYLRLDLLEIHHMFETWSTWDSSTCVWFTWDVLDIFLRLEVLEIHLPVCDLLEMYLIYFWDLRYLRFICTCVWFIWDVLDIFGTWGTWDSSYIWDLIYLRFIICLRLEVLEIHLPVSDLLLRCTWFIWHFWGTWDSCTCVWFTSDILDLFDTWTSWDSYLPVIHFYTFSPECVGLNMFEKTTFCFSKQKFPQGYLSEFCAVPAN